jgi:hypothetical protein
LLRYLALKFKIKYVTYTLPHSDGKNVACPIFLLWAKEYNWTNFRPATKRTETDSNTAVHSSISSSCWIKAVS